MRVVAILLATVGLLLTQTAVAVDASGERYISMLVNGGPSSIRSAAESIYHTNVDDREVQIALHELGAQVMKLDPATANVFWKLPTTDATAEQSSLSTDATVVRGDE